MKRAPYNSAKIILKPYFFALAALLLVTGCMKPEEEEEETGPLVDAAVCQATKVVTVEEGATSTTTITFDSRGRMATVNLEQRGIAGTLHYNADNTPDRFLVTKSPEGPGQIKYTYTNGRMVQSEVTSSILSVGPVVRKTYAYNSAGKVSRVVEYRYKNVGGTGALAFSNYYAYTYDAAGNIIKEEKYVGTSEATATLDFYLEYTHDTAPNPLFKLETLLNGTSSTNNIKTATFRGAFNEVIPDGSYSVAYTYNTQNFYTQAITTYQTGPVATSTVTYQCQE
ncbi:hypothetical protein [Rufibacter sp. LB8]|uniref:hypothetical protein n=1 Tax=Rufibacter sp. LB8 TaxID=2777781 RepID=UPI00178C3B89|nr:hypothetical protein [Rufibacter sp. LB8]